MSGSVPSRRGRRAGIWAAVLAAGTLTGCAGDLGLPEPNTDQGETVGRVFDLYLVTAYVVAAIVVGLITFVVFRYRASRRSVSSQRHHNTVLEIVYTVIPLVIVLALTVVTIVTISEVDAIEPDPDVIVDVEGYQWGWTFTYVDNGHIVDSGTIDEPPELVLPAPARVQFDVHSDDVIHSFWVPAFRFKRDLIPGTPTSFTVDISEFGVYPGKCAEYCGFAHTAMDFSVRTVSRGEFEQWLAEQDEETG